NGLSDAVMSGVRQAETEFGALTRWRRAARSRALLRSSRAVVRRRVMLAVASAAAVAVVVVAFFQRTPVDGGTQATIGGAAPVALTSEELTSARVGLEHFLTTPAWRNLASRPASRDELRRLFGDRGLSNAISDPMLLRQLANPSLAQLLAN